MASLPSVFQANSNHCAENSLQRLREENKAFVIDEMSSLGQRDGKAGAEKWCYARCTLKVRLSVFADGLSGLLGK